MSSTIVITDRLIKGSMNKSLQSFILDHMTDGGDKYSLVANIAIATSWAVTIDTRTAESWMRKAQDGGLTQNPV